MNILYTDAVVGFEQTQYLVNESAITSQVCVVVTHPPPDKPLPFTVSVRFEVKPGTAGSYIRIIKIKVCIGFMNLFEEVLTGTEGNMKHYITGVQSGCVGG